ncbi:MAG: tetratricopeptide repeat protein [Cyanobacteriota bacterium]|nr:tetratricopeptide repeat protein [Cyanobacteriota bacterium]
MKTENILNSDLKTWVRTAAQKHQQGELEESESMYRELFSSQPNAFEEGSAIEDLYHLVLLDFGNVLERRGKLHEAVDLYQQALKIKPDFIQAHFFLASQFSKQGKLQEAVELYQQALKIKPDFIQAHFYLANTLSKQGKLNEAVESYQQVIKLQPNFTEAHFFLANLYQQQGKLDRAVKSYQQVLKLKPDSIAAYHNLGNLFKQQGQLKEAMGCYQQVLKLDPNCAEVYYNLGNLLKQQGKIEKATQFYQQALELKPDFLEGYISLGSVFRRQGKAKEAIQSYQRAVQLNPDCFEARLGFCISQLPIIYTSTEEIQTRRENYQQCLQDLVNCSQVNLVKSLQPFVFIDQPMNTQSIEYYLKSLIKTAAQNHQLGELEKAEFIYQKLLFQIQPNHLKEYDFLTKIYHIILMDFGNVLQKQGKLEGAIKYYQEALKYKPDFAEVYYNMGCLWQQQDRLEAAIKSHQQVLKFKPSFFQAYNQLGIIFQQQGEFEKSAQFYQQALKLNPNFADAYNNLGNLFKAQGKFEEAIQVYQKAIHLQPNLAQTYSNLGNVLKEQNKLKEAVESYQKAIDLNPNLAEVYRNLAAILRRQGKVEESIEYYQHAFQLNPELYEADLGTCISQLAIIYTDLEDIQQGRSQYQNCLQDLTNRYQNLSPKQQAKAASAVGSLQPFYLAYQGLNDRPLQQIYGQIIHQLMSSRYPQFSQPISNLKVVENEKIRVGFVSGFFCHHSNWKIPIKGWVENLDSEKFELFGYYTNLKQDDCTEVAQKAFNTFVKGPLLLEQWCKIIQRDRLHVLIFPEFGMDSITLQLGCLRLAPIQMTSWGHPETSGLPTIDYYLSSDLMEPDNAQDQYTEKLVRLPNLSIHYTPLNISPITRTKAEIGLRENEVMFWCCQSLYKYLPQHDDVFPQIAQQLKNCKFVFIKYMNDDSERVTDIFSQRLSIAFDQFGLNAQDYCVFLPPLKARLFAGTTALSDVFLDSIGWSGCNSSLEAITCDLPIVTLPGELMRGRHTFALLKMMGLKETIAKNKQDYISIAVRLGQDVEYRQQISQKIAENKHKLYGDLKPVRALEDLILDLLKS